MHDRPRQILRQLIFSYGQTIIHDPRRVDAFLQDVCGQHHREIFVLVHAQEQQIPRDLLAAGKMAGDPIHWQRLSRRLQDRLAITAEAADWAVESWAMALNVAPQRYNYPRWLRLGWESLSRLNLRGSLQNVSPGWKLRGRSFGEIGVQWRAHFQRWLRNRRWIVASVLALVLMGIASFALRTPVNAWISTLVFWQDDASATSQLSERAVAWLNQIYPPPRSVRIGEEAVALHAEVGEDAPILAYLTPPGALVTIDAYSQDGLWAHVSEPIQGWIAQTGVYHLPTPEGTGDYAARIVPTLGIILGDGLRVRQTPTIDGVVLGDLSAQEEVLVLAATADGAWFQIVEPMQGWVSSEFIAKAAP